LRQLCLIVVALSSPVEEDDCTQIPRELLRQPKRPERSEGQPNDTEPLSPHRRMALEASHAPDNVPAGPFVVEFREQLLRLLPGRRGRPAVQVGSKSDEPGACEPVGEALEEIRQTPPCVEDQDARSAAFLRDGQESRDLAFGALEFNHSHVLTSIRRKARPNRRVGLSVCSNGRTTPSTRLLGMSFLMPRRPGPL